MTKFDRIPYTADLQTSVGYLPWETHLISTWACTLGYLACLPTHKLWNKPTRGVSLGLPLQAAWIWLLITIAPSRHLNISTCGWRTTSVKGAPVLDLLALHRSELGTGPGTGPGTEWHASLHRPPASQDIRAEWIEFIPVCKYLYLSHPDPHLQYNLQITQSYHGLMKCFHCKRQLAVTTLAYQPRKL